MSAVARFARLSRLTIQQRIIALITASILVLLAIVGLNFTKLTTLSALQDIGAQRAQDAQRAAELSGMSAKLYQVIADTEIDLDFAKSREAWAAIKAETAEDLAAGDQIVNTPPERAQLATAREALDRLVKLYENQLVPTLEQHRSATPESVRLDNAIGVEVAAFRDAIDVVLESLKAESLSRDLVFDDTAKASQRWALMISAIGVLALVIAGLLMVRDLGKVMRGMAAELKTGAQQVASASSQVASSSQQLSQGSTEEAASLEETSASMEEMASMTRQNAENSQHAAQRIAETEQFVTNANSALSDLVVSMRQIRDSSGKVTKIIKTIDEIAFQTNILALNAAVEAARAGEAGMGFAVVADEVRNLAQRSAQAAKDTAALIEESAVSAESGGVKVDGVVSAMQAITRSSEAVKRLIDEVSTASQQQTQGIDQVTHAIHQLEKVTQTTAATAEESAAASEELNAQAEQSLDVVARMESLVGVRNTVLEFAPAAPAARVALAPKPSSRMAATEKVVKMRVSPKPAPASHTATAEDILPLDDTGTYGKF